MDRVIRWDLLGICAIPCVFCSAQSVREAGISVTKAQSKETLGVNWWCGCDQRALFLLNISEKGWLATLIR